MQYASYAATINDTLGGGQHCCGGTLVAGGDCLLHTLDRATHTCTQAQIAPAAHIGLPGTLARRFDVGHDFGLVAEKAGIVAAKRAPRKEKSAHRRRTYVGAKA